MSEHVGRFLPGRFYKGRLVSSVVSSRWLRVILAIIIACTALSIPGGSVAAVKYRLKVKVTDCAADTPLIGALVQVTSCPYGCGGTTRDKTDENGVANLELTLSSMPPAYSSTESLLDEALSVTIQVSNRGYKTKTARKNLTGPSTKVNICLEPLPTTPTPLPTFTRPAPTEPPLVIPPPVVAPSFTPTPDPLQPHAQCLAYINNRLGASVPGWDTAQMLAKLTAVLESCRSDRSCISGGVAVEAVNTLVKELVRLAGYGAMDVVQRVMDDPQGSAQCANLPAYYWELVRQLTIAGLDYTATAIYSPVAVLAKDPDGRRSGFLQDGTIVKEIPGSAVIVSGDVKYLILPAPSVGEVSLKGTGEGPVQIDLLNSEDGNVQDASFESFNVTLNSSGELNLAEPVPVLEVDLEGNGHSVPVPLSRYTEWPVQSLFPETPTPSPTVTSTPALRTGGGGGGLGFVVIILALALGGLGFYILQVRRRGIPGVASPRAASPVALSAQLNGVSGAAAGRSLPLGARQVVIGRGAACDLVLPDQSVSRQHARIVYAQGGWFIQDMGSKGGVRLNGQFVQAARLQFGDQVQIGSSLFRFQQ